MTQPPDMAGGGGKGMSLWDAIKLTIPQAIFFAKRRMREKADLETVKKRAAADPEHSHNMAKQKIREAKYRLLSQGL